jgi:hypothetical protein
MTMYYGSRFAPKPSGTRVVPVRPAGRTLAEALADAPVMLRIRTDRDRGGAPRWDVGAWTAAYAPAELDDAAQQQLGTWIHQTHPAVNLWIAHCYDLRTGQIGKAPEPGDTGFIPEDDASFGEWRPMALMSRWTPTLPFTAAKQARRAA